jgi:prophage regulatory protein
MNEQLLRLPAVLAVTGLTRSTLYRLAKSGDFPQPIKLIGGRASAWLLSAVNAWIQARIQAAGASKAEARKRNLNAGRT